MKTLLPLLLVASTLLANTSHDLPRATPESQGVSSAAIAALVDELDARRFGVHSLIIVRHGNVIAEGYWAPFGADDPHMLFSLSKSFTSTAIGMLQTEGKLRIEDPVLKFFPEEAPAEPSANLRGLRVSDLLQMTTGQHQEDVEKIRLMDAGTSPIRAFLATPFPHKPGTHWFYNSHATFMLSAIVQKVTGQTLRDYLVPRLFAPLGIPTPEWDATPHGYSFGASGLHLRTMDIAKFGQLYLQRGEWGGRRLLPAAWVDLATSRRATNGSNPDSDWDQGYGYQFWRCVPGFYRGDGANGQFCIVMPQHDTVVAINSGTRDMGGIMKTVWRLLLPELRPAALPENAVSTDALRQRLGGLVQPVEEGAASSPIAARISGKRYAITPSENPIGLESIGFDFAANGSATGHATIGGREITFPIGHGTWAPTEFAIGPRQQVQPSAATGAWTADDTYSLQSSLYRTPTINKLRLKFSGDTVAIEATTNLSGNPPMKLTGRAPGSP